jgi:hypothetical protein
VGNKAAFINIKKDLELKFVQFTAAPHPNVRAMMYGMGMMGGF